MNLKAGNSRILRSSLHRIGRKKKEDYGPLFLLNTFRNHRKHLHRFSQCIKGQGSHEVIQLVFCFAFEYEDGFVPIER